MKRKISKLFIPEGWIIKPIKEARQMAAQGFTFTALYWLHFQGWVIVTEFADPTDSPFTEIVIGFPEDDGKTSLYDHKVSEDELLMVKLGGDIVWTQSDPDLVPPED